MVTPPEEPAENPATPELPRQPARKRKHATIYGHGEPCLVWQVQGPSQGVETGHARGRRGADTVGRAPAVSQQG